ncbi:ATP-dependent DNA helicase [Undibacterium terreum]|uniref:DEAD/DEAH box helicase n=1 Tax=Undibacterium terreum TaxID=1224302 RepID=A0A916U7V4_9BURK|nr:ATP-dependent DNA helicase [Undibacterium terreum]GGC62355.1 DEAD/DEAH box helicase [Undibacterium terreum]
MTEPISPPAPVQPARYAVAVRALCEFTAKLGDLDLRFTPSPTAQEGIAGHATVTSRRPAGYLTELSLSGDYKQLTVRGRADGYDPTKRQLEEIKTYRGDLKKMPANHRHLHWAQVKIYGHLLCLQMGLEGLDELSLALVYFDIASQKETVLAEPYSAVELKRHFEEQCEAFLAWAGQELAHKAARDLALDGLEFPHQEFRTGQRHLAETVYRAASTGRCLMVQAPTGIGKTIGTLYPLLRAMPKQALDKIFFLSAKTPGRRLALDALHVLKAARPGKIAAPLRVLELVARDKACEHPDKACHGDSCPLARGFYDRLPQARQSAIIWAKPEAASSQADVAGMLDQGAVRDIARQHQVCPYYLSQDLARWADVIVGDYNYYFDISAMLYSMTQVYQWKASVLVDEAHNLVERGRKMYSAELDQAEFNIMRRTAPAVLKKALDRVSRQWNALHKEQGARYQVYPEIPEKFLQAMQQATTAIGDFMVSGVVDAAENNVPSDLINEPSQQTNPAVGQDSKLLHFYFDALLFTQLAEAFGEHSLFDVIKDVDTGTGAAYRKNALLCIRNIVPAPFLKHRFQDSHSTVLFSATLSPWDYYSDMLGLPGETPWINVESPFRADQLEVNIAAAISTRYRDRDASLQAITELMAQQYRRHAGNYLAFFSSFDYLQKVAALFAERYPDIPQWQQSRGMEEAAREEFLARFTQCSEGIGFAVLGGAFAEGIDLPGSRLIGAFIATLGLPQLNPVNEQIMQRMDSIFGRGYDYTYLFPGLQKVVQAAGRVIRTQSDQGYVYLIDDRFKRPEVRALLPAWWKIGILAKD